jgi:hypothetical protein
MGAALNRGAMEEKIKKDRVEAETLIIRAIIDRRAKTMWPFRVVARRTANPYTNRVLTAPR